MAIYDMNEQMAANMRLLDLELLHSLAVQAEIIPADKFAGGRYQQIDSSELFSELLKAIAKDRYHGSDVVLRSHKNQEGISFSIRSEQIENLITFAVSNRNLRFQEETDETRAFSELVNKVVNHNFTHFVRNATFQRKENRVVFYFTFNNQSLYQPQNQTTNFLCYAAFFEMLEYVDFLQTTDISHFEAIIASENEERMRREEEQRQRRAAELAQYQEEQERQRRELEERSARSQAEYEQRQALLRQGATEGGIDIANQLLEFLGRR